MKSVIAFSVLFGCFAQAQTVISEPLMINSRADIIDSHYHEIEGKCIELSHSYQTTINQGVLYHKTELFLGLNPAIQCQVIEMSGTYKLKLDSLVGTMTGKMFFATSCKQRPLDQQQLLQTYYNCQKQPTETCNSKEFLDQLKKVPQMEIKRTKQFIGLCNII